ASERPLETPRWNLHKYLTGRGGNIAAVFAADGEPIDARVSDHEGAAAAGIKRRCERWQASHARRITDPQRVYPTPQPGRFRMSAQPKLMPDVEGLAHQVDPLSRRGFFLAASAAAAAGYTLAAGPVRADAIHTDTTGISVGEAKVKVSDGEMPVY